MNEHRIHHLAYYIQTPGYDLLIDFRYILQLTTLYIIKVLFRSYESTNLVSSFALVYDRLKVGYVIFSFRERAVHTE